MGSYYEHRRTESVKIPYSFRCEQCMNDSGIMWATVGGIGTKNSIFKEVGPLSEEKMRKKAHKDLVRRIKRLQKTTMQKQVFPTTFSDECPCCHKPQSWGVSGIKEDQFMISLGCLIMGAFFSVVMLMDKDFGKIDYEKIPFSVGIAIVAVVAAIIYAIRDINKVNNKKKITDTAMQKNLPVIEWEAVQYLLDEQ